MPKYIFQARNNLGKIQVGQVEASDEFEVARKLRSQQLSVVKVMVAGGSSSSVSGSSTSRVNMKDLQIFTRQFATLINAGIPVVDCLKMLGEGKKNQQIKDAANRVKSLIEQGKRLGDAMASMPEVFDRFYVNMVRAGEEAGILDGILQRLAIYMEKSEKIKKQVKGALVLPIAILFISAIVVTGILIFVIPKFQEMYSGAGQELPFLTRIVVGISETLNRRWYVVLAVMIGTPWVIKNWLESPEGKATFDEYILKVPLFGELIQKSAVAKLTRTLSTLLSSGVSVIDALEIAARTAGNVVIEQALARSKESVMTGRPLAAPLQKEPAIPDMVGQMIAIGEQSGTLDIMLGKIADFYEDDVENAVKAMTTLIEPLLMVFLGGIIAVLVLAMYMPIFGMADVTSKAAGG